MKSQASKIRAKLVQGWPDQEILAKLKCTTQDIRDAKRRSGTVGRPKLEATAYERLTISVPAAVAQWIRDSAADDECSLGDVVYGCVLAMQEAVEIDKHTERERGKGGR